MTMNQKLINQSRQILSDVFGYQEFRPLQEKIIQNILNKKDTLVIMPTGGGKSICYQIPALIFDGVTLVVSPLISLMKDQVEQLSELGVPAVVLNSSLTFQEYQHNVDLIINNKVKLLYLAPETLLMPKTQALLSSKTISCLTIDEAHCISEWGHDFRPEYRHLIDFRAKFPNAVCVALTATATPRVQQDIKNCLQFESSNEFIASFNRTNLFIQIIQKTKPVNQAIQFLKQFPNQSGIIYCLTRRTVDDLTQRLLEQDFSVKPYHAGLSDSERRINQELFIRDDIQIIVATVAFGMGINKPNIRFVLHYDLPKNIEGYYQQIGRAGRDGLNAHCLLLFSYGDIKKLKFIIDQKNENEKRLAIMHLNSLIALVETDECRRKPILNYFGETYPDSKCGMCDNCETEPEDVADMTIPAQKFLSCVARTKELFGAKHIIDVLRGSKGSKVFRFNHQELSTYGIGKDISQTYWIFLSRQFIIKGLLKQDTQFGSLKLTEKAWRVMRGTEKFYARMEEEKPQQAMVEQKPVDLPYDHSLFSLLREKRKVLADQINVPPYVIFPDKTLIEMATYFPQSKECLMKIYGIGIVKLKKYGQSFLDVIQTYCQPLGIKEKSEVMSKPIASTQEKEIPIRKYRYIIIGEEFNSGKSIQQLANELRIKVNTVISHLFKFATQGYALRISDELLSLSNLSDDIQQKVFEQFRILGHYQLKPIFDHFNEQISYDALRFLQIHYHSQQNPYNVEFSEN